MHTSGSAINKFTLCESNTSSMCRITTSWWCNQPHTTKFCLDLMRAELTCRAKSMVRCWCSSRATSCLACIPSKHCVFVLYFDGWKLTFVLSTTVPHKQMQNQVLCLYLVSCWCSWKTGEMLKNILYWTACLRFPNIINTKSRVHCVWRIVPLAMRISACMVIFR